MRKTVHLLLAICISTTAALPRQERIVGGSIVDISRHPFAAVVLRGPNNVNFRHECGSTIINNRSVLSAAHCWMNRATPIQFRIRVGSTNAHSGGTVFNVAQLITHPSFNVGSFQNNDIGVVRLASAIVFGNNVRVGSIAGPTYNLSDNELVWAVGWGQTSLSFSGMLITYGSGLGKTSYEGGTTSEQLRQVQLRTVNQGTCRSIYGIYSITDNMLCVGWNVDGRGICSGDSGGPLIHGNVIVGVVSMGGRCGQARFPGVFARVSRFTSWIQSNA